MKAIKKIITLFCVFFLTYGLSAQINFSVSLNKGCSPLLVEFNESHTKKNIVKRFWNFGNSATSTLQNPSTIYTSSGRYTVTLITEDANGIFDTLTYNNMVEVFDAPIASFETNRSNYCVNDIVNISDKSVASSGSIRSYLWDFGDGKTYTTKDPKHSYNNPGTYTVTLLVTDVNGCNSTSRKTFFYNIGNLPSVDFTTDKKINCGNPLNVKFTPLLNNQIIKSYFWEFGDGSTSFSASPSHDYKTVGSFNVKLSVIDTNGCENKIIKENTVENLELRSRFEDISSKICDNESVSFKNLSTPKRSDIRYRWEFGDGTTSTQFEPTKKYTQSGNYTIKLISFIPNTQCADTFILNKRIDIIKTQNIVPIISDTLFCKLPNIVFFEPSDSVTSAFWRFTSSPFDTSSKVKASFLFTRSGNFNISYEFRDINGCLIKGTKSGGVKVTTQTVSIRGILSGCVPITETFRIQTTNASNIISYSWYLDDVLVGTDPTYTNTFKEPAGGRLRVVVRTNEDCEYTATANYNYGGKTGPDFFPINTDMCFGKSIRFLIVADTTKPPITSSEWIFEDQRKTSGEHKFTEFKDQKVTLITRNRTCPDTTVKFFSITGGENSIKGPVSIIGIDYDICARTLKITNKSLAYTSHRWNIQWDGNSKHTNNNNNSFIYYLDDSSQNFNIKLTTFNDSNDCPEDTMVVKLKTIAKLLTSFKFDGNFCAPAQIQFTNTSNYSSIDTFRWFVNGSQVQKSTDDESVVSSSVNIDYIRGQTGNFNPLFKFGNSGEYEIMMIGERHGCIDTIKQVIKITGPEVRPGVIKNNDCLPLSLSLVDSNYRAGKKSMWIISNVDTIIPNSQSTLKILEKSTDSGIVKIKYVEWDENDCVTWKIINLPVNGPLVDFVEKLTSTCDSSFVEFSPIIKNVAANTKLFYLWELGDGTIVNSPVKFTHRYKENKSYNVKLTVTDDKNCFSSKQKEVNYFENLLKANIIADTSGVFCPPVKISFRNSSTSASPIVKYKWEFGDGTYSFEENPEKVFIFAGVFSVKLTVENNIGCIDSIKLPDFIVVNGPTGNFVFDKDFGCVPLDVNFKLISENSSNKSIWDMGDGRVLTDTSFKHTYDRAGDFYPMLIIRDTFGCEYIVPRDRKITVYDMPVASFDISGFCYNDTTYFKNTSKIHNNQTYNFYWYFGDSLISTDFDAKVFIDKFGEKNISLSVKSNIGCEDSISKTFKIKYFNPDIKISNEWICLGESISITSKINEDQQLGEYRWIISGDTIYDRRNIEYTPKRSGHHDLELYMRNVEGCDTSLYFKNFLLVRDTIPNKNPEILSVSVLDDFSVEIKHRSSNEIGFKSYQIYRRLANDELKLIRTTTNVNDTFLVETGLNTLYNVYCYIVTELNTCEYESYIDDSLFHCTIDVKGRPDTNVSILNWNAYYGWKAVEKYEIYRKKEIQNQFTKIGEVPGDSLSYNDSSIFCRDGFYYRILAYDKNSNELSWSDTCKVTPIYFNIVPPPKFELSSILNNKKVELYWSKPVNSRNNIIYYVIDRSDANQNLYRNIIKLDPSIEFYIDGKVDVNNFNYFYKIKAIDQCDDISEYSELTSPILLKITLNDNLRPFLFWTPYKKWDEGVAYYEIEQLINGVFTKIGETQTGDDTTFTHNDFIQNCFYPYVYRVFAVKNTNDINKFSRSLSNEVNLKTKPTIFAPNAFSPNGDGLNDIYEVKGTFIKSITMNIYNRWGEKLYETQNCLPTWDGYYMQRMVPDGVYVALVRAVGTDDQVYTIRTTVTVIK